MEDYTRALLELVKVIRNMLTMQLVVVLVQIAILVLLAFRL